MQRRTQMEDLDMELERQTFNLNYDRWLLLYKDRMLGDLGDPAEIALGIDDLDELDRYMAEQEQKYQQREQNFQDILTGTHTMTGASPAAPIDWRSTQEQQWGPWT